MLFSKPKFNSNHSQNAHGNRNGNQYRHHNRNQQQVIIVQTRPTLPPFMKRMDVLCNDSSHPLPVMMKCIGEGTTAKGSPQAIYACPFEGCGNREGYVVHHQTGKPWRLWQRKE